MKKEYYIQGNPARAEEIKAEFKRLGIDTTAINVDDEDFLYFSSNGLLYFEEFSNTLLKIFKTHPGYTELPLPVEPKFNVGDWIANDYCAGKVIALTDDAYLLDSGQGIPFSCEHNAHLWTIQDAKDGDVITNGKLIVIFNKLEEPAYRQHIIAYVGLDLCGRLQITEDTWQLGVDKAMPATKEQRDLLFAKMKEAGYQWDAEKKELKKIPKHYDIANFYAGMPVLVRADNVCRWDYSVFSRITGNEDWPFAVCNGVSFTQCIPFEGNETLLGTTDMCDERFINW